MTKIEIELLGLAKFAAIDAANCLLREGYSKMSFVEGTQLSGRETKISADTILEDKIISSLSQTDISILSEERGFIQTKNKDQSELLWVIDPLDGSLNFSRGIPLYAISIALWRAMRPCFGVIYFPIEGDLIWGGVNWGAFVGDSSICVSKTKDFNQAILCTGLPARFDLNVPDSKAQFWNQFSSFGKIRMLGSAARSLAYLAMGSVDAYSENNIMLWDVAAGLAILEGAGGSFQIDYLERMWECNVSATNGLLPKFLGKN
ncbi:SuhB Archaeal fructose-1,6-bisphosphatase and related enzymes of inositol monophosphatase family [Burkholderiaceae bacterium]